jgi:hypothetical protein
MHPTRLERVTYSSVDCRSIQLSYGCFPRTLTIGHNLFLAREKGVPRSGFRVLSFDFCAFGFRVETTLLQPGKLLLATASI